MNRLLILSFGKMNTCFFVAPKIVEFTNKTTLSHGHLQNLNSRPVSARTVQFRLFLALSLPFDG